MTPLKKTQLWGASGDLPKRVVVKVGSALLTPDGPLGERAFERLAREVLEARHAGVSVTLVSSGAIAQGRLALSLKERPQALSMAQALAAVGQPLLMQRWSEAFAPSAVAQFLLTLSDVKEPKRFLNARHALQALEEMGVIGVGNENDTVATEEIKFGDNDRLGAYVAQLLSAEALVIYTQVDGLYTANPEREPNARRLEVVERLDEVRSFAEGAASDGWGTGGMQSKLEAVEVAHQGGASVIIAHGATPLLELLRNPTLGTVFPAPHNPSDALRQRWPLCGRVEVSAKAWRALEAGASLDLREVIKVDGAFTRGELIEVSVEGEVRGRALAGYEARDCALALRERSVAQDPRGALGAQFDGPFIHAQDWALARR